MYFSNFHSVMSYGITIWGNSSDIHKIFIIQKRSLRVMLRLSSRTSCRGLFKSQGILTTTGLYIFKCLVFMRKNGHYFEQYRNLNNTRRIHVFHLPKISLTLSQRNVEYMCLKLYNKLPRDIQMLSNLKKFKVALRLFLMELEPYTLKEYLE